MAFANLFSRLAAVDEDVGTSDRSDVTCRNETGHGERSRKRKTQGEEPGSHKKKICFLKQTITSCDAFKDQTRHLQQQGSDGERELVGNTKEIINHHNYKACNNSSRFDKNQKYKSRNNCQVYNEQQKLDEKMEKNQQQGKDGRRPENGGGRPENRGEGPGNRGGGHGNRGGGRGNRGGGRGNRGGGRGNRGGGHGNRGGGSENIGGGHRNRGGGPGNRGGGPGNRGGGPGNSDGGPGNRGGRHGNRGGGPGDRGGGPGNRGGGPGNRGGGPGNRGGGPGNRGGGPGNRGGRYGNRGGGPGNRGGRYGNRGGGPWNRGRGRPPFRTADISKDAVQEKRFMTQEFKDQNALLVDGRLLCRHFILGRCLMADNCQLEHVEAYNDLIKQVCKFYVQEVCTKGERCPYMHKSFPCKYYHRKGDCSRKEDCRFSHEPLNEVTEKLLEEAIEREEALRELAKRAERDSSVQPANTEESEFKEADRDPEILKQPLRPNFYNSTDAEKETSDLQTEDVSSETSDAARPQSPPPAATYQQEPVCYSVEAVLGPQMSRPYISFFGAPRSEEPAPVSVPPGSSDVSVGATNQGDAPYSVDAVLKSYKSLGNSTCGQIPTFSSTQSLPYTPEFTSEKVTEPFSGSQNQNQNVPVNTREEVSMYQEKMFSRVCAGSIYKTYPDLSYSSGDHKKQGGGVSESQRPAQRASSEARPELSRSVVTEAEMSASNESKDAEERRHLLMGATCSESSADRPPQHHTQLKPHLSGLTSDSESSRKAFSPSLGVKELNVRVAAAVEPVKSPVRIKDSSDNAIHHFGAKTFSEMLQNGKTTQSTPKPSQISHRDDSLVKRPFRSLFAPLTSDSVAAPACPRGVIKSPQSAKNKTRDPSFHSLFVTPLRESPASPPWLKSQPSPAVTRPCSQQSLLRPKHRGSGSRAPLPFQVKAGFHSPASPELIPDPGNDHVKQVAPPVSQLVSSDAPTGHPQQQLPDASPLRDSAAETSANSVLKMLFLSLRPYPEDGEKRESSQSHSEEEKKMSSSEFVALKQQQESPRKKRRKKRMNKMTQASHQQSAVEAAAGSAEHQPSSQTTQSSAEAAGVLDIRCAGASKPQERNSGTRMLPFTPAASLMQHPGLLKVKQGSEEGDLVNGNAAVTPFKDLFKSL